MVIEPVAFVLSQSFSSCCFCCCCLFFGVFFDTECYSVDKLSSFGLNLWSSYSSLRVTIFWHLNLPVKESEFLPLCSLNDKSEMFIKIYLFNIMLWLKPLISIVHGFHWFQWINNAYVSKKRIWFPVGTLELTITYWSDTLAFFMNLKNVFIISLEKDI